MTEKTEPICPDEDDIYRPYVEDVLGIKMDNLTFEKIAWYISDHWLDHVMEGPPEHREVVYQNTQEHTKYIAYLLRDDLDRAKLGSPYPMPMTTRMAKVWDMAKTLYDIDDPNGFLGPSLGEMVYVGRAVALARDFGNKEFEDDLVEKIRRASIWPWGKIDDDGFHEWENAGGIYAMFEHRGSERVSDDYLAQRNVQSDL